MNPHFIFNILSSIQSKVLNEKTKEAYNDISTFSKLIRSVLDYSSKEFIKLNDNEIDLTNLSYFQMNEQESNHRRTGSHAIDQCDRCAFLPQGS
jgi:LytS/YehU family sensor histidine kinase